MNEAKLSTHLHLRHVPLASMDTIIFLKFSFRLSLKSQTLLSCFFFFFLSVIMEANYTEGDNNYSYNHSHSHHPLQSKSLENHNDMLPSTSILLIVIPIIIIVLLIAISLLILMLKRIQSSNDSRIRSKSKNAIDNGNCIFTAHRTINIYSSPKMEGGCLQGGSSGCMTQTKYKGVQVLTYKELEMCTDKFSETYVIGNGGYGVVYRGVLADGTVAAIKSLQREGKQWERSFRLEVDILSRLHSPYLVKLLGYCADQHHRLLIFEYMTNGSLQQHLHNTNKQSKNSLKWGVRLRIALDCARALEYLHEHTTPSVIHRDFKCSNVLLDQSFRAKVSDFGLAKIGSDKINGLISTRVLGTTGYLAPEYASTGKLTTKSDVYSYGVVLLELLTGRVPINTRRPPGEHVLVSWALPRLTNREKVVEMVDPTLHGQYSNKDLIQVAAIAAMCVQTEADYRPLMTDVVQSLLPLVKTYSSACPSDSFRSGQSSMSPRS